MERKVLAVIAAFIVATGVLFITLFLITSLAYPPTPAVNRTPELLRAYDGSLPTSVYILLILGYAAGGLAAGFVVTKMARRISEGISLPVLIAALLIIAGIVHIFVFMPGLPAWVTAAALISLLPLSLAGHSVAQNWVP